MALVMPVNAADLTAAAYGRRKPKYPVIPETLGLALMLLINRNTARERGVWLAAPEISDALCRPAEAFAEALEQRMPPLGWRGGALASLRSLAPGTLHQVTEPWPVPGSDGTRFPTGRFWVDDDETWYWRDGSSRPPVRAELARRLAHRPRIGEAWDALLNTFSDGRDRVGHRIRPTLAAWSSLHERPGDTRHLHAEIVEGRDLAAEQALRHAELLADYLARHPDQPEVGR